MGRRNAASNAVDGGRWANKGLIPVIVLPSGRRRFRRDDVTLLLESTVSGVRVGDAVVNL